MNKAKALKIRKIIETASTSLSDELALEAVELFPQWSPDEKHYEADDRVRYDGVLYKALVAHDSQFDWSPEYAHSLWAKVLIPDPDVIPEWEQPDSTNAYMIGDRVRHYDRIWESLINNNVWEPGVLGTETLWTEVTNNG